MKSCQQAQAMTSRNLKHGAFCFTKPTKAICFNSVWILQRPDFPFALGKTEVLNTEVSLDCCSPAKTAAFRFSSPLKVHFHSI